MGLKRFRSRRFDVHEVANFEEMLFEKDGRFQVVVAQKV
jgi:hypothetical protein